MYVIRKNVKINLQNIANDTDTPHVRSKWNAIKINYFGRNKFRCTE